MEKEKCRLVNIIKYDRFYDTVNFKACWKYKENISTQQASLTEEGVLERYSQARDITLKVMRGTWLSRLQEPHDTEQGNSSSGSWFGHLVSCVWQGGGKGCEERVKGVDPGGPVGSCMGGWILSWRECYHWRVFPQRGVTSMSLSSQHPL